MTTRSSLAAIVVGTVVWAGVTRGAFGEEWPQWRGLKRDGHSPESGLLGEWPDGGPPLVWQVKDLGRGYSAPVVAGGRLFVLANEGLENELVKAFDADTGKPAWATRIGKVGGPDQRPNYPAARSTPTVDGDRMYVLGSDGDLACLECASGKIVWQKNVRSDFGGKPGRWAYAESPLVDGDAIVCSPGGAEATLLALKKKTGEVLWKSAVPGGPAAAYTSIITVEPESGKQYVQFVDDGLVGVDAKTGKLLWSYKKTKGLANIPTPVARGDLVYSGGSRAGGALVKLTTGADGPQAEEVYFNAKLPTAIGGAVLVDGHLYGATNTTLMCVDFESGDVKWQERSAAPGSLCYADGRLYLHSEGGDVLLVEATPEAYREKGRFTPPGLPEHKRGEKSWAYPLIASGRLYVRDLEALWCYDVRAKR